MLNEVKHLIVEALSVQGLLLSFFPTVRLTMALADSQ
jgi:hypothetical protein